MFVDTGDAQLSLHNSNGGGTTYLDEKLIPKKVHVVFRPTPYSDKEVDGETDVELLYMQDLPQNSIDDGEVIEKRLKIGRNGTPSLYTVVSGVGFIGETQGKYFTVPQYDTRALELYGHNPMVVSMENFDTSKPGVIKNMEQVSREYQKRLKNWFRNCDRFLIGTIKLKGNEELRVGQALNYERRPDGRIEDSIEEGRYYIRGVDHDYTFGVGFYTTADLDRGTSKSFINEMKKGAVKPRKLLAVT